MGAVGGGGGRETDIEIIKCGDYGDYVQHRNRRKAGETEIKSATTNIKDSFLFSLFFLH